MDDVRKFFRYILPGLAFAIQLLIALCISDWKNIPDLLKNGSIKEILSLLLVGFLASGGLGYIFSLIYYGLYWFSPIAKKFAIDHISVFKALDEFIEIRGPTGNIIPTISLSKEKAWVILTRFWFNKSEDSSCLKGGGIITERMSNIVHSIGATIVATILSITFWIIIHYHLSIDANFFAFACPFGIFIFFIFWLLFLALLILNYFQSMKYSQSIINSSLIEFIMKEYNAEKKEKVIIWYSD